MEDLKYIKELGNLNHNRTSIFRIPNTFAEETKMISNNVLFISSKRFCHVTKKENTCNNEELNELIGKRKIDKIIVSKLGKDSHWAVARKGAKIEKIVIGVAPICSVAIGLTDAGGIKSYYEYDKEQCGEMLKDVKFRGIDFDELR